MKMKHNERLLSLHVIQDLAERVEQLAHQLLKAEQRIAKAQQAKTLKRAKRALSGE